MENPDAREEVAATSEGSPLTPERIQFLMNQAAATFGELGQKVRDPRELRLVIRAMHAAVQ